MIVTSQLAAESASYREVVAAGDFWMESLKTGQTLRILIWRETKPRTPCSTVWRIPTSDIRRWTLFVSKGTSISRRAVHSCLTAEIRCSISLRIPVGVTTLWEGPARQSRIRFAMRWKKVHARLP